MISAYHDIENSDLQIDFNDIQDFLNKNKNNNDIDFSQNSNIMKVIDISKKYFKNQKYTSDFLANYCEMLQLEGKSQNWFYAKNTLQNIEMKYQDRATKELKELGESEALEKTTYTFICEDNTLLPDGRESYRIVTMDKKFYDEYIKFNNTCYLSDAYVKMFEIVINSKLLLNVVVLLFLIDQKRMLINFVKIITLLNYV